MNSVESVAAARWKSEIDAAVISAGLIFNPGDMNKRKFTSAIYRVSAMPKLERTVVILILSNFHVGHRRPGCVVSRKETRLQATAEQIASLDQEASQKHRDLI